jgi:hypothetical protein
VTDHGERHAQPGEEEVEGEEDEDAGVDADRKDHGERPEVLRFSEAAHGGVGADEADGCDHGDSRSDGDDKPALQGREVGAVAVGHLHGAPPGSGVAEGVACQRAQCQL